jgi:hypothetical protein
MKSLTSRLFVVCILGSVGLLAAEPASADKALFRVQRTFLGAPFPAVTTPGGAGRFYNPVEPYKPYTRTITSMGATMGPGTGTSSPPGTATVEPSNPIGAKFTLPRSFIDYQLTTTAYPSTAFTGYLTRSVLEYVNGQARFGPNNPNGAMTPTTVSFADKYPGGTTTHGGIFDFSRDGFLKIDPGTNHFGGTMRYLHAPTAEFYQYISYFNPLFFKAYGSFRCTKMGVTCTEGFETELGEATSSGMVSRYLLDPTRFPYSTPTPNGKTQYRKIASPPAISKNYYLHLNAPFTTGAVAATGLSGVTSGGDGYHPHQDLYGRRVQGQGKDLLSDQEVLHDADGRHEGRFAGQAADHARLPDPPDPHGPGLQQLPGQPGADHEGLLPSRAGLAAADRLRDRRPRRSGAAAEALIRRTRLGSPQLA